MIDIIIPIYNAYADVLRCLDSVLRLTPANARIVVIDDASTDPRIAPYLSELQDEHTERLLYLQNLNNVGFVQTVNRGMALGTNDVVLLNSDTEVTSGWLDRLVACADADPQTATVTPFSNNAEICSYPVFCRNTQVGGLDLTALCQALAQAHDGTYPEIPTAVGFCMFIRRKVLDAVGLFDAERFGRGYGEENEFCCRASVAGYKHWLCTDAFVVHHGGRSFLGDTSQLKQRHLAALLELFPDYNERIVQFVAADPIAPYRQRIQNDLAHKQLDDLGQSLKPGLLLVTHALGGGVEKHVQDLVHLLSTRARIEILRPHDASTVSLQDAQGNTLLINAAHWGDVIHVLNSRQYARLHIHHLHGYRAEVTSLPQTLGLPTDITVHDFAAYCPQYSLSQADGRYCGEPDLAGCARCVEERPNGWGLSITQWRDTQHRLLSQAERIFAPSDTVANKIKAHWPTMTMHVLAHPPRHEWLQPVQAVRKIVIMGGLSPTKGLHRVLACAVDAHLHKRPLHFVLLGYTSQAIPLSPDLPVSLSGQYEDEDLPALLALQRADAIWFPSQIPETYSYTLDVAMASGLPVLADAGTGAVAQRLASYAQGHALDENAVTHTINQVLSQLTSAKLMADTGSLGNSALREAYGQTLLHWLTTHNAAPAVASLLSLPSAQVTPDLSAPRSLQNLYEHGVECGHKPSRLALAQRVKEADELHSALAGVAERSGSDWFVLLDELQVSLQSAYVQIEAEQARGLTEQQRYKAEEQRFEFELQAEQRRFVTEQQRFAAELQAEQQRFETEQKRFEFEQQRINTELQSERQRFESEQQRFESEQQRFAAELQAEQQKFATQQQRFESEQHRFDSEQQRFESEQHRLESVQRQLQDDLSRTQTEFQQAVVDGAHREQTIINTYEQSISWRMTQPFRNISSTLRTVKRGLKRWPFALQILREQGLWVLLKRIQGKLAPPQAPAVPLAIDIQPLLALGSLVLNTCSPDRRPQVSVVIPVYGQHQYTFNCLSSLAQYTDLQHVEVIVVDDASPDPARPAMPEVQGVRWVRNTQNLGFIGSCHAGADLARGEYVLMLNNDVQVTAGWLEALLDVFKLRSDAGMVGARLVYPNGSLQEAGGIVWQDGSAWNWGRNGDPELPTHKYLRPADYCSGACLLLRMSDWQALHGFDKVYTPAYYEDTDLAFRVRAAGQVVYYQPEAVIVHYEGISSGTDVSQGAKKHQVTNQVTFFDRWKSTLSTHRLNGVEPLREVNRWARHHMLIVEACMITPDQDAGSVRMQALLEILVGMGVHVTFVAENLEYRQPYVRDLQQQGVEVWYSPHIQSVTQLLEQRGALFDTVMICRHYIASPLIAAVRQHAPQAQLWFDTVDLHYLREERLAALEQSSSLAEVAAVTKKQELGVMAACDLTFVVSPVEQALLAQTLPDAKVAILSTIYEPLDHSPGYSEREGLLFVGGFQHPPNVDAVTWFVQEVWPLVHAQVPEMKVRVVGSKMPDSLRSLAGPGIEILGFVQDIDPLLAQSRISIAPLRYGAGVKGKVNQAMSHGLPVVATPAAVEGMDLTHGEHVLVADSPAVYAQEIIRLYNDPLLWQHLVDGGKANVAKTFSRDVAREELARQLKM
jgi:GT2 family glycosyltransferase/glycosyltransferase involved in cell wall biosynthesis